MTAGLPMNAGFQPGDCMELKLRDSKCLNQAMDSRFRGNDGLPEGNASR